MPIAWAMLVVMACYAIATTHDALSRRRAQRFAAEMLQRRGAPRTAISAGLEFDAWTQLTREGYINRPGVVRIEHGSPFRVLPRRYYGAKLNIYWVSYMPSVRPRWFVFLSPMPQAARTAFSPVIYRCWLPPFRRALFIQCATPITPEDAPLIHRPAPVAPVQPAPEPTLPSAASSPAGR
jgi:hypothetical protein